MIMNINHKYNNDNTLGLKSYTVWFSANTERVFCLLFVCLQIKEEIKRTSNGSSMFIIMCGRKNNHMKKGGIIM